MTAPTSDKALDRVLADIRRSFPMLVSQSRLPSAQRLAYLDNAATALKPQAVLDAVHEYDAAISSNIHRGVHRLGELATERFERCRLSLQSFIGARSAAEIILTSGTTFGINLVALGWARHRLKAGDEILLTTMEHHANLVPWHLLARERDVTLRYVTLKRDGQTGAPVPELDLEAMASMLGPRTRLVSLAMVSNAVGTINPVPPIMKLVRELAPQAHVLLDAAQAVAHHPLDVVALGCSALAFSGHKMLGPTGTGALYLREDFRDEFVPCIGGGDMIRDVTLEGTTFADFPARLEPGTPNISGFIGLDAAVGFIKEIGFDTIAALERRLSDRLNKALDESTGVTVVGRRAPRVPLASMTMTAAHPHDVATLLDRCGVAVRAGHHCAQPLMHALGLQGTARASLAFYNDDEDVEQLARGLQRTREMLQ